MLKTYNVTRRFEATFDNICELHKGYSNSTDSIGNPVRSLDLGREVPCQEMPVSQSEFFAAARSGIRAELLLRINSEEYARERYVQYDGRLYEIYRIYRTDADYTELYLRSDVDAKNGN